jgi:hypothetical protein
MRIRTSANGDTELAASVEELHTMRDRVRDVISGAAATAFLDAEMGYDPSPYDTALARLVVASADQPVCVAIVGDDLRVVGSSGGLDAFCSYLIFDDAAVGRCHSHYEYYEGHAFISPNSKPLVITVGS